LQIFFIYTCLTNITTCFKELLGRYKRPFK
jgi:hypothetical protein